MEFNNVCRLCLANNNLRWIFNERNENVKMKDVIYIATGIEVDIKDVISQKICENCYNLTNKIIAFRRRCLKNNAYLKEIYRKYFEDESTFMPNTTEKDTNKRQQKHNKVSRAIHPSITKIYKIYPQYNLPPQSLKSHIAPVVCLKTGQVENYFKNRNLDIDVYIQHALKSTGSSEESAKPNSSIRSIENNFGNRYLLNKNVNKEIIEKDAENFDVTDRNRVKKRRQSENENASAKKKCRGVVSKELLDQKSVTNCPVDTNDFKSLSYVKLISLHICSICKSVQNSFDDLRKHENSHAHCQFCKTRFRTLQHKNLHIDNFCIVKKTMNNLPIIMLEKIEHNIKVRHKYPGAFDGFPLCDSTNIKDLSKTDDIEAMETVRMKIINRFKTILSGAADPDPEKQIGGNNCPSEQLNVEISSDAESSATINNKSISAPLNKQDLDANFPLINPDIEIRKNRLLDNVDFKEPDLKIMKVLLDKIKALDLFHQKYIQTDLPMDKNIARSDKIAKLKGLKQQLYVYKIPITTKEGTFNVSYGQVVNEKRTRKLCLWNNLIPTDIKPVSIQSNNSTVLLNKPIHNGEHYIALSHSDTISSTSDNCQSNISLPLEISPTDTPISQSEQPQNTIRTTPENQIKSSDVNHSPLENVISDTQTHISIIGRIRVKNIEELIYK